MYWTHESQTKGRVVDLLRRHHHPHWPVSLRLQFLSNSFSSWPVDAGGERWPVKSRMAWAFLRDHVTDNVRWCDILPTSFQPMILFWPSFPPSHTSPEQLDLRANIFPSPIRHLPLVWGGCLPFSPLSSSLLISPAVPKQTAFPSSLKP